jgi:FKBP-type peptidyl-prolyl cis-trans isomerase
MMRHLIAAALGSSLVLAHAGAEARIPVGKIKLPVLSYTVEKSGPVAGAHPTRRDLITVNYRLTLLDGTEVDASAKRGKPDEFPLNRLIPAWQILLQKMRPGDIWTFYVPPEYGYGAVAREGLPANSFLVFRVELVSFAPAPADAK